MKRPVIVVCLALLSLSIAARPDETAPTTHSEVGRGLGVNLPVEDGRSCAGSGTLYANYDGSFETGYAWQYGGVVSPYYGAFAEGFGWGDVLECVHLQLSTLPGYFTDQSFDIYVWGSDGENPSCVLSVLADVHLGSHPAYWPSVSAYDIDLNAVALPEEFFVGYWGNWPGASPGWYIGADLDGFGGLPRTNIAPGVGYPTGWNDPSIIWGRTQSLGIGVWINDYDAAACCHADGTCRMIYGVDPCAGVVRSDCCACPPPATGACCGSDGLCAITTRFECESGDWRIGAPCEPNRCPASALGACCVEGICTVTAEEDCPAGSWLGPNTECQPNPCPEHPAEAADCSEYESYAHWVGSMATAFTAVDVAIANGYACIAGWHPSLQVADLADPRNPRTLATLPMPGRTNSVAASGTHAYVTTGTDQGGSFVIVNVSDPAGPIIVGSVPLSAGGGSVAVDGDFAYVRTLGSGASLVIINVAVPQHPVVLGSVQLPGYGAGLAAAGGYAFVASHQLGLVVIDVSDPQSPWIVGAVDTPSYASDVAVSGSRAYVADYESGLQVIDITNPANPQIVGGIIAPGLATHVKVSGTCAYVVYAPDDAYSCGCGLAMIDVADPQHPELMGQVGLAWGEDRYAMGLDLKGTFACVADELVGLQVIDVANPRTASILGAVETPGWSYRLAVTGSSAYIVGGPSGLQVVDTSDPAEPQNMGSAAVPGYCKDVDAASSYAFVAGQYDYPRTDGFLSAIDVADPTHPLPSGMVDLPHFAVGVALSGTHAIVIGGYSWSNAYVRVIDVSNPQDLKIVGMLALPEPPLDVAAWGDYAYVADGASGLLAIDISEPSDPRIVGRSRVEPFSAFGVGISGGTACVALDGGIQIVDIAQPWNLRTLGLTYISWEPSRVCVQGIHAAIADSHTGVQIVDFSDPWSPRIEGGVDRHDDAFDVVAANGFLFATDPGGLLVLRRPCEPDSEEEANASAGEPAEEASGMRVLRNPAWRQATIRFDLEAGGYVHATIHDVTGRRIRELFAGSLIAAAHDLPWDGRDDGGREVPAGVYLARVATSAGKMTKSLVLLR